MTKKILHITNGEVLTKSLEELGIEGDILTWNEMLCEGPTEHHIDSEAFFETRKAFLKNTYNVESKDYKSKFIDEIEKIRSTDNYSEIVLWFEYDLFCHINLVAVIALLQQKLISLPLSLVCSGRVSGEKELKGLSELTSQQLIKHYEDKTLLNKDDINTAITIWRIYCGGNHNDIKPFITKPSSFTYLSNCLKAHLKRFPNTENGLCSIETNILELIHKREIKSLNQLMGYALTYQGYYGYGDTQIQRMVKKLMLFIDNTEEFFKLNKKGVLALEMKQNFSKELSNDMVFGGAERLDFQFDNSLNKLLKIM